MIPQPALFFMHAYRKDTKIESSESEFIFQGSATPLRKDPFHVSEVVELAEGEPRTDGGVEAFFPLEEKGRFIMAFPINGTGVHPGKYGIYVTLGDTTELIEHLHFTYQKAQPFLLEQIKAIESDPYALQSVCMQLGCKQCTRKLIVYTALERDAEAESKGSIWQQDLPVAFQCECGRTKIDLKYMKESMHGLLGLDRQLLDPGITSTRKYAHSEIMKIVSKFNQVLDTEKNEPPLQKFIEDHPVMLARFHAKKLSPTTTIIGKFVTDFTILDTRNQLVFVELEKPSLKLFKKGGHTTSPLMHAYDQVRDWIREYEKHPYAVLDVLKIKPEEVSAVKGVVIAGRSTGTRPEDLQRHLSKPIYSFDFLTYDDLAQSVVQISRDLTRAN